MPSPTRGHDRLRKTSRRTKKGSLISGDAQKTRASVMLLHAARSECRFFGSSNREYVRFDADDEQGGNQKRLPRRRVAAASERGRAAAASSGGEQRWRAAATGGEATAAGRRATACAFIKSIKADKSRSVTAVSAAHKMTDRGLDASDQRGGDSSSSSSTHDHAPSSLVAVKRIKNDHDNDAASQSRARARLDTSRAS